MPSLLAIKVSPRFDSSISRKLTDRFVDEWRAKHPGAGIVIRDLARDQPPYVDLPWIGGAFAPPEYQNSDNHKAIAVSDELVAELRGTDHLLIGTPMYNFSIPAVLKAWIDHIVRIGVTVGTDNVGLLTGKKATIIIASGGNFSPGSPIEGYNQASGYLRQVLGWIGITDVDIILADRARAGQDGETAVEQFGGQVEAAAA